MDFHSMKRKQLQAFCKKHGVPANLTNRAMANRLASMFREKEEPVSLEKLNTNPEEIGSENEAKVVKRQAKKVRFSPENQTFVYEVSVYRRPPRRSRKQLSSKNPPQVMENAPSSEDIGKAEDCQVRVTRSRVQHAVKDGVNMVFSPPVARKRGSRGIKNKHGEVNDIGKPEVVEMGDREDVKNGNDEVTGGVCRWQLRSKKNFAQEDSKKVRKSKAGDDVHLLNESVEQSDVVRVDLKTRNGPKQTTRNARKVGQAVELRSEVEKVKVVSRATRQSRALRQKAVPQKVSADNSLLALEGAEAEKPLRRSKRNVKKDWAKSAPVLVQSETQVTKPQERYEGNVALEGPPKCARRYSTRRKSVLPVSSKGENDEQFAKSKNKKRTRMSGLDVIVEHSGEAERAVGALTLDHGPLRRSRRKTVILNTAKAADAELANREDIGKMQQLGASSLGKDVTEELPRKSMEFYGRASNLLGDDTQTSVHGRHVESEVNCTSYQSVGIKSVLDDASCSDQTFLEFESNAKHVVDSSEITLPAETQAVVDIITSAEIAVKIEGHGMSDQEMKENTYAVPEFLVGYKEDRNHQESEKELVQDDTDESDLEMNHNHLCLSVNGILAVDGPNLVEPRQAEFESKVTNTEITSAGNSLSLADQMDLTGATSSVLHPDKKLETEPSGGESSNFASDRVKVDVSRTPLGDDQILMELNDTSVTAAASVRVATFEDQQNESDEISALKKSEEMIATTFSNRKGIPNIGNSVKATKNKKKFAELYFPIYGTACQKITGIQQSTYANTAAPETPSGSAPENQVDRKMCSFETSIKTSASGMSDQGIIEDLYSGNAHCVHECLLTDEENTVLVKNDEDMRIHDDNFEGEMKYQFYRSLKGKGATNDTNLVELRMVDFESNGSKVISPEITSPAGVFSSASQSDLASKFSSCVELVKMVETKEHLTAENIKSMNDGMDAEGNRTPVEEDQIKLQSEDDNVTAAELIGEVLFNDLLNELRESIGLKRGSEISLKKTESQNASESYDGEGITLVERSVEVMEKQEHGDEIDIVTKTESQNASESYDGEGITLVERSVEVMEKQEHGDEIDIVTKITGTPNVSEINQSLSSEITTYRTPFGGAPQSEDKPCGAGISVIIARSERKSNLLGDDTQTLVHGCNAESEVNSDHKTCRFEGSIETSASGMFDQGKIEDLHPGNAYSVHESVLTNEENSGSVKNDDEIRIHDDNFEGEMKYQSCLSLKGKQPVDDFNLVELRMVEFESNGSKAISPEITSSAGGFSSASRSDHASKFSSCIELVKVMETKEHLIAENIYSMNDSMDDEGSRSSVTEDQIKLRLEDAHATAAELTGDLLNELGESICLKRGSEICLKKTENQSANEFSEGIALAERSIEVMEKEEHGAETDIVTKLTCTPNITEIKQSLSGEIAICRTPFGVAPQSQGKLCSAGITVSIFRSDQMCYQDEDTSLMKDEDTVDQDNIVEAETKYQPGLSLNKTDEALAESRMVELESNASKVVFSSASQANLAGETSNELNLDKEFESEESPSINVNYESDKIEVEDNKNPAQKDLNLMRVEDTNMTAAEPVPEVVLCQKSYSEGSEFELCETRASKEFNVSLKKAEEMRPDNPSGRGMMHTESSVKINEKSEATAKIHDGTAGTGEKIMMQMQRSLSGHDTILISSPRPKVGSQDMKGSIHRVKNAVSTAGYRMSCHQKSEENVKLVENENEETINTEGGLFIGGIFYEDSERKFLAGGACRPISDSIDSQCAKGKQTDIAEASFHNVSSETQERHVSEVFDGEGTDDVSSEEKDKDPFSMRLHDHALVDGGRNCSVEVVLNQPFTIELSATMNSNGISAIRETDVGQPDNIMQEITFSSPKVELGDHGDCKMDAESYDSYMNVLQTILQKSDNSGRVSTEFPGDKPDESVRTITPFEKTNCGDLDDRSEEIQLQYECSSSIVLDGFTSSVGIIVDNNLKVGSMESTLNSKNTQSGKEVEDLDVNGSGPYGMLDYIYAKTSDEANKFDSVSMVEEAGKEDCGKTPNSYRRSSHGGRQEDVPSYIYTTCSKSEISFASSTPSCSNIPVSCVAREERDECQKNTWESKDVIDGFSVENSRGDPEEIAYAKSDACEVSVKIASFMDNTDGLLVNQPLCLDESKSFDQENEEPHGFHLRDNTAGDSREVGCCRKLDIVSSVKPEIFIGCSSHSICATSNERKHLENPDESHILTNAEMSLFWASEDEAKKPDSNAGDTNHAALDKIITDCNSSDLKEGDYVACSDVKNAEISAKRDDPEAVQEIIETRKDASGLNAAVADKSAISKNSVVIAVNDHKEAFRSQLDLLSSQKKSVTAKKELNKSVFAKLMTPSTLKSKNKSNLIQRTPKRLVIHDAKENELSTKMEQIGSRTTPKTSSKRRPLERVWKY